MLRKSYIRNWFSNMLEFDQPLRHQGIEYRTVENFYQAMKTAKDDLETRRRIAAANPYEAKRLGRGVRLRTDWADIHLAVMETALRHKFAPGTRWHTRLMATGDEEIVEWNNWGDRYWGRNVSDGRGENHLGRLLMKLRDEWRKAGYEVPER
jgi:ribA/ribD-fused uncharacterized protein